MNRDREFTLGLEPRGNYKRVLSDDGLEAERLFNLGYRQVSNKYGIVARIDVPDLDAAMEDKFGPEIREWEYWSKEDHWRRCYSKDKLEGVSESVMKLLRKIQDYQRDVTSLYGRPPRQEIVAICVDNTDMEESFDRGIEYLVSRLVGDTFICVFDRFGQVRECFADRFRRVEV